MAKPNRLFLYGGLALVVVVAIVMTEPQKIQRPPRKSVATATRPKAEKALENFDDRDKTATFETVALASRDAFKPLVVRGDAGGPDGAGLPNQVPASFASGEAGWFFTGAAIIDQVPTALLENTQTGQGLYVKQGDLWKNCRIERITPTSLTLGNGDNVKTLMLLSDIPQSDSGGSSSRPLNPISGQIGVQARPGPLPGNVPNNAAAGGQGVPNFSFPAGGAPGRAPAAPGPGGPGQEAFSEFPQFPN